MNNIDRSLEMLGVDRVITDRWKAELQAPHRHYHTLDHISHIIDGYFDICRGSDTAILAAAWLHDIRYDATRSDNEEVSAEIAKDELRGSAVDIPLVVDIILDTKTHAGGSPIFDLFSDLDLLIFSRRWEDGYEAYMRAIRREYGFVPLDQYATARAQVLRGFDTRQIFKTEGFVDFESIAHSNLQREIELLETNPAMIENAALGS